MPDVFITGHSILTAFGSDMNELWKSLRNGKHAVSEISRFSTTELEHHLAAEWHGKRNGKNPIAEMIRSVVPVWPKVLPDPFIIWTGVKSDVPHIENPKDIALRRPADYRHLVGQALGTTGRGLDINAACASSTTALGLAFELVRSGREKIVAVCGADYVSRFTHMGFAALNALSRKPAKPFDKDRDGLTLGDGAVFSVVCTDEFLPAFPMGAAARLTGWGSANDANHITSPARDGRGLVKAIKTALEMSGRTAADVTAYCAHGTGTVYNDAMETAAARTVFSERNIPAFSVKGGIGHTLGAAGGIEAVLCCQALKEKTIPPTIGLETPDDTGPLQFSDKEQTLQSGPIVTANSGFGGINTALILEEV